MQIVGNVYGHEDEVGASTNQPGSRVGTGVRRWVGGRRHDGRRLPGSDVDIVETGLADYPCGCEHEGKNRENCEAGACLLRGHDWHRPTFNRAMLSAAKAFRPVCCSRCECGCRTNLVDEQGKTLQRRNGSNSKVGKTENGDRDERGLRSDPDSRRRLSPHGPWFG